MSTYLYSTTERNNQLDEFLTPKELIDTCFVQAVVPLYNTEYPRTILDVGANDGRWGQAVRKHFPNAHITGVEWMDMPKPEGFDCWYGGTDFIQGNVHEPFYGNHILGFDLVIGNPPYRVKNEHGKVVYKAEDFVRKAYSLLTPGGHLVYLLRTNFVHSLERYWIDRKHNLPGLWQTHPLHKIWFTVLRPSFFREDARTEQYGTKQTNAHDYTLFGWQNGFKGTFSGGWIDWSYA